MKENIRGIAGIAGAIIAIVTFILALGTAGADENGLISSAEFFARMTTYIVMMLVAWVLIEVATHDT